MATTTFAYVKRGYDHTVTGPWQDLSSTFKRVQCSMYGHGRLDDVGCTVCGTTHIDMAMREVNTWFPAPRFEEEPDEMGYYHPLPEESE